jgi:glycosyltransferase involved in cell wall biosynthesis
MVGATEPVKNQAAGVEAVARLRDLTGVDVGLRVVGPVGRAESAVRHSMTAVDPDGAWTSREVDVPVPDLEVAYSSSWLLLQPSHDEGFGLPLVEAARHGLPAVHSGRGAMPSVLPEVDAGGVTPEQLAGAMAPLLDAVRWQAAAEEAAARARVFEPDEFREAVRAAVSDLLPEVS